MPRLFTAIDLPDEHKARLTALQDPTLSVRWTPEAQYHLTLRFIGDVDEETLASFEAALASVQAPTFELEGNNLGVFPSLRRPRVIYAGIPPKPPLLGVHASITHELGKIGIAPDTKPFRPHITIARVKKASAAAVRTFLRAHQSFTLPPFSVSHFHLYESILRPEGALHLQRRRFALGNR
ncbi:MAG TPA: RNA 2',3'-cyclic phosphodiesterase [Rhodothermales bacterium]|nr:RNA 2',3'-cyclic phosphodiesterase [Rhodothermales bacterium]